MSRQNKGYQSIIDKIKTSNIDVVQRTISLRAECITLFYIKELTDLSVISEHVIKPLSDIRNELSIGAVVASNIVTAYECSLDSSEDNAIEYILKGMSVVLFSSAAEYLIINSKKVEKRSVTEPEFNYTLRAPRDSFIENIEANLSLIRYRIQDTSLKISRMVVGARTKSSVAVVYLEDVVNDTCVNEIKKRIENINVDGLVSSGELKSFLLNRQTSLFPQMGVIERSDMACGAILEGKVVVIMDGSPWALVAPKVFSEFLWSCDDLYNNMLLGIFTRILRVLSLSLSFIVSSLYVAIVSYHNDVLPASYMIAIAQSRAKVPFNALIEVLLIEIISELIRESLIRVPTKIGTAIGIVGAIIIGQAAVSAGVFSPLLLIVISLSLIASFIPSDQSITNPFRILKFFLIFASGTFGFYGFTLVIILVIAQLVSISTFGVPYMAPAAPFNLKDFLKSFIYSKVIAPYRPAYLRNKDATRSSPNNKKSN